MSGAHAASHRAGRRARTQRSLPKRRAERPSLAARVVLPTTAAAGTGAVIVLVTATGASAPSAAQSGETPSSYAISATETVPTTEPSAAPSSLLRSAGRVSPTIAPTLASRSTAVVVSQVPLEQQTATTPQPSAHGPKPSVATPTARPVNQTTQAPAPTATPTPTPTPTPEPTEDPSLVPDLLGVVGGLLDG